jgi:hypothetical protein
MMMDIVRALSLAAVLLSTHAPGARAQEMPTLSSQPTDLITPPMTEASPGPGLRTKQTTPGWEGTGVYHALYLPRNWSARSRLPVFFEYAGNGGFHDAYGDTCAGTVDGCNLGYGLSGGMDYIWVCLPFVQSRHGVKSNTRMWWGDPSETARYCVATARYVCAEYGGDSLSLILCGFSRGAIACNYVGLRDDTVSALWRGFLCHSYYDGVNPWPYPDSDRASALTRLRRLRGRPQFISSELSTSETRRYLKSTGVKAPFTFEVLPFPNHTDTWALRDCGLRRAARAWLCGLGLPGE